MNKYNIVNTKSLTNDQTMLAFYKDCQQVEVGDVVLITQTPSKEDSIQLAQIISIEDTNGQLPTEISNIHYLRDIITQASPILKTIKNTY